MKRALFLVSLGLLAACEPTLASRGNILDPEKMAQVHKGSTREEVAATLGTPTQISTFDDKTWYYVGRQTRQYSFLDPEVLKQKAIEIKFDDQGIVASITDLNLSQAYDVAAVERTTPTYGNDNTLIQQLIGNMSHITPDQKKQEGQ